MKQENQRRRTKKSVSQPVNRPLLYFFYLLTRWHHSHTPPWIIYSVCTRKKAKSPIHAWNDGASCLAGLDRAKCMWRSHNSEALRTALLVEKESKKQKAEVCVWGGGGNNLRRRWKKQISVRKLSEPEERSKAKAGPSSTSSDGSRKRDGTTKGVWREEKQIERSRQGRRWRNPHVALLYGHHCR